MELFYNLKSTFKFPVAIQAFDTLCESVMLKVALSMEEVWKQNIRTLQNASRVDEACISHPLKDWLQGCAVFNLRSICQKRATYGLRTTWKLLRRGRKMDASCSVSFTLICFQ